MVHSWEALSSWGHGHSNGMHRTVVGSAWLSSINLQPPPDSFRTKSCIWSSLCLLASDSSESVWYVHTCTPHWHWHASLLLQQIVCRNCSRNKYPMKYLKDQAAKVCDSCYVELKKRGKTPSLLAKLTKPFPAYWMERLWDLSTTLSWKSISYFKHQACVLRCQECQAAWQLKLLQQFFWGLLWHFDTPEWRQRLCLVRSSWRLWICLVWWEEGCGGDLITLCSFLKKRCGVEAAGLFSPGSRNQMPEKQSCIRRDSDLTWGNISSPSRWSNPGRGFLERQLMSQSCQCLRGTWATHLTFGQPRIGQAVGLDDCCRLLQRKQAVFCALSAFSKAYFK